jgi:hypothetical protein
MVPTAALLSTGKFNIAQARAAIARNSSLRQTIADALAL